MLGNMDDSWNQKGRCGRHSARRIMSTLTHVATSGQISQAHTALPVPVRQQPQPLVGPQDWTTRCCGTLDTMMYKRYNWVRWSVAIGRARTITRELGSFRRTKPCFVPERRRRRRSAASSCTLQSLCDRTLGPPVRGVICGISPCGYARETPVSSTVMASSCAARCYQAHRKKTKRTRHSVMRQSDRFRGEAEPRGSGFPGGSLGTRNRTTKASRSARRTSRGA